MDVVENNNDVMSVQLTYTSGTDLATRLFQSDLAKPRSKKLEQYSLTNIDEDSCSLFCDAPAVVTLLPCRHQGYCSAVIVLKH
jgi:hypothetical protein